MGKVLVAMSGGVDSSAVAAMLLNKGFCVSGITMKTGDDEKAVVEASAVCKALKIEHHVVNVCTLFSETVIKNFLQEYKLGRTPNPCVLCNKEIKFGYLMDICNQMGFDYFATGHYATIKNGELFRGVDTKKDQSYFLYSLYSKNTDKIMFPLGTFTKQQVREFALGLGLPNAKKEESQDICFVTEKNYAEFLNKNLGCEQDQGAIVDINGKRIGTHCGIYNYTVGQRKGLGALGKRMFVKEICPQTNTIVVGENKDLFCKSIVVNDTIFGAEKIDLSEIYQVQVRYKSHAVDCHVCEINGTSMRINFVDPVRAAAPGQSAVLYKNNKVLAGGIIDETELLTD